MAASAAEGDGVKGSRGASQGILVRKGAARLAAAALALAAALASAGAQAQKSALADVERPVAAGDYWAGFVAAFNLGPEEGEAFVRWAEARSLNLPAAYLMPLAARAFRRDPAKGLNWFYFARLRLLIDIGRCDSANAGFGLLALLRTVEDLAPGLDGHPGRAAAWRWALDHDARHPSPVLPGWDCAILAGFPRVTASADVGQRLRGTAFAGKPPLRSESQWAESRNSVRLSFERNMAAFIGEPKAAAATKPQPAAPPTPRAPLPPPPRKPEIAAKAPPAMPERPANPEDKLLAERLAKASPSPPPDEPEPSTGRREATEAALRREAESFPDPPDPPARSGRPGKLGPVPTGEPDDPFHIVAIEGDGWRMLDSGPGLAYAGQPFYWLDAKRVFFAAHNATLNQIRNRPDPGWHFVWDADRGIEPYPDLPLARRGPRYCHADGRLKIQMDWRAGEAAEATHVRWRVAEPGAEKEVAEPMRDPNSPDESRWNEMACRHAAPPAALREHVWAALRDGDGYLDFGPSLSFPSGEEAKKTPPERQRRLRLRRFAPEEDIELPIGILEAEPICVRYFAFKGAYFLFDCLPVRESVGGRRHHWSQFDCLPAWWLWRDGRAERMCVPSGPWNGGAEFQAVPTARGLFVATRGDDAAPGRAGGYLIRGDRVLKVASGTVTLGPRAAQANVSADGCRVAFAHAPDGDGRTGEGARRRTMRILDVCAGGAAKPRAGGGG
jgi:hypothetical protein